MSDVTGPISTLPGTSHDVPDGMMCDDHPDRPAVARIQGETDSFGCEMEDLCQQCNDERRAYRCSEAGQAEELEWRTGPCEWCKNHVTDLRDARDYEEGMSGRVYRVCGACIKRVNDEAQAELDAYDFGYDDDVYEDECFNCGGEGYVSDCFDGCCEDADSGCDLCTRRCDVCNPAKKGDQP
ncbi:hypothetical protein [Sinorhizobium meliloti]|uniref:hypothetical protein n=1 Tax=Rhizobium meliloti TaxID=382 RepID=UPI000B498D13|nr:hypothetical protein [Sinorhizobium meliloti]ASP64428.1 hypothetical protein CDO29_07390 [Sinorhizobium meliloti]MQX00829.1 hypothetical protein [Sinorhizobium meliloti]RVG78236.1 hypothetical protein CN221_38230 [Sinorhizobium meliloti]RVH56207.1 hypothetical protein CN209_32230 [Sinorhizobium meliloti]RVK42055.1 hypothetical protein CN160_31950 [Sinorhizobium meliloti]